MHLKWKQVQLHPCVHPALTLDGLQNLQLFERLYGKHPYGYQTTPESLQQRLEAVLAKHGLDYDLKWTLGGRPFLTPPGTLVQAVQAAIRAETGLETELSTTGGTSDGRFIAQICPQVIELGPPNASIHKIDEHIAVADIEPLTAIYRRVLENLAALPAAA